LVEQYDQARQAEAEARERAATLAGRLDAIEEQNAALLARLSTGQDKPATAKTKKTAKAADEATHNQ